jgi:sugar phosphate isomerase/epimerase
MVQKAVSSMFFHEYTCDQIFDFVTASGLSGIEFWVETPDFWLSGLPVETLSALVRDHPLLAPVTMHAPVLDLNPCSINPGVAETSIKYTVDSLYLAQQAGVRLLTIHPGRRTAKRPVSEADHLRFNRYISAVRDAAAKTSVVVAMENMEPKVNSLLCSPEKVHELLDHEPWLNFTLDIAHAMAGAPHDAILYIDNCFERIANVHVSGVDGDLMHTLPSECPETEKILQYLADCGYQGPLTLELEDMNFADTLSSTEKITILSREAVYLEDIFE